MRFRWSTFVALVIVFAGAAKAALIVNPAQPITERVRVRVIGVANTDGSNAAPMLGTAAQQAAILLNIGTIWSQAGIDIQFSFRAGTYNDTFANIGTPGSNNPRSGDDLGTIVANGGTAGVLDPDPKVINLFMVRIVPAFSQTSDNTSNGLAFIDGNGITAWAGPNLPAFTGGQEVIAGVLAHEIGHNLGLPHIVEAENLMQAGGSANSGQRLNAAQIATARGSQFAAAVPEPGASTLLLFAAAGVLRRRSRVAA